MKGHDSEAFPETICDIVKYVKRNVGPFCDNYVLRVPETLS